MNNAFLIASITIIILTIIIAKKYLKDTKKLIPIILLGLTIALTVLVYPVCNKSNFIGKTVFSIVYSAQTIILNENLELIDSIAINQITDGIYVGIMYIISLLMPLLTVSFLLTLIGDIIAKIKIKFINKEQILIFSSVNEKSIAIAQKLSNKNNCIIFANYEKGQEKQLTQYIKNINYIKLNSSLEDIDINKFKSQYVNIYIFEDNEDTNLNLILKMIEKYKNTRHDIKLYPLLNEETSRIILDSTEKGNLQIEIVNEIERTILQLLQEKPLYLNTINNEISVLIVGCGKVGKQFLKIITWCGQIIGYDLKINVIDINANKIKANIIKECPELIDNYNYNFIEADITSYEAIEELNKLQNINYILVALDNDEKNIKEAIFLRRYFMWRDKISYNRKPIINIWIKDKEKNKQVDTLKNEKSVQYDLNAFGSTIDIYYKNPIINSTLERVSQQIHLLHDADDRKLRKYYEKEYNVKSSRATASHIKYKIY